MHAISDSRSKPAIVSAAEVNDGHHLRILEVYGAVQGEGLLTGVPSTFVRLAGCTVGCKWCDTKYSWKAAQGSDFTPEELVDEILAETSHGHVVITGGEPMEHPASLLEELATGLYFYQCHITVETSGTVPPTPTLVNLVDLWSISPKLSTANTTKPFPDLALWHHQVGDPGSIQLKFVIGNEQDLLEAVYHIEQLSGQIDEIGSIILQPCSPTTGSEAEIRNEIAERTRLLQEHIVQNKVLAPRTIRVTPQLHAILYGNRRGI